MASQLINPVPQGVSDTEATKKPIIRMAPVVIDCSVKATVVIAAPSVGLRVGTGTGARVRGRVRVGVGGGIGSSLCVGELYWRHLGWAACVALGLAV